MAERNLNVINVRPTKGCAAKFTLTTDDEDEVSLRIGGIVVMRFKIADDSVDDDYEGKIVFERYDLSGDEMLDGTDIRDVVAADSADLIVEQS